MSVNKTGTEEEEREISLNEISAKHPLNVLDVIGGHGPWQFRQWLVFFVASFCNAMVLFSALFLPSQSVCNLENSTVPLTASSSVINNTAQLSAIMNHGNNQSSHLWSSCNSSDCVQSGSEVSQYIVNHDAECSNSTIEYFAKCIYVISCFLSGVAVYYTTTRFDRRHLALTSCLFVTTSSLATAWADIPAAYLILRFVVSLGTVNIYLTSAFSLMEYVHKDYKILYFLTGHLGWGMASLVLPAISWLAEDWKSFNLILSATCFFLWFFVWWGPESPSLLSSDRESPLTRHRKALKYAAFMNGYSTTDVDLLPHGFHLKQGNESDSGTPLSPKQKGVWILYSCILFLMSFITTFMYFSAKWHAEWFKVHSERVSFSFLGTTEVAGAIILLFLTYVIAVKYLWAFVSLMTSALIIIIYSRNKPGSSTSSAMLYTVTMFFAAASWTLLLTKLFCHKIRSMIAKLSLIVTGAAAIAGALAASVVILKASNEDLLLIVGIPYMILSIASIFLLDDDCLGTIP